MVRDAHWFERVRSGLRLFIHIIRSRNPWGPSALNFITFYHLNLQTISETQGLAATLYIVYKGPCPGGTNYTLYVFLFIIIIIYINDLLKIRKT